MRDVHSACINIVQTPAGIHRDLDILNRRNSKEELLAALGNIKQYNDEVIKLLGLGNTNYKD